MVGVGACVSIQFGALEFMKRFFNERNGCTGGLTNPQLYLAGAIAGIANSVVSGKLCLFACFFLIDELID